MRNYYFLLIFFLLSGGAVFGQGVFVGSTPAHHVVRDFLGISLTDSIDFIRWKLVVTGGKYELACQYGLAQGGTPGFANEKRVAFQGEFNKTGNRFRLKQHSRQVSLVQVNADLLHFVDEHNQMLVGNGGYSYALNNTSPVKSDQFNIETVIRTAKSPLVFEGRTPCQELSSLLALNKTEACNKMKWYIIFYTDSVTGKPSYFLKGGRSYKKETMERGKWQILTGKNGRVIYKVNPDSQPYTLYLLKGDDNILFFTDADGRLLVGDEHFSYTLNRRKEE